MKWYTLIATWFGSGLYKFAPGTLGSLATLPLAYMLHVSIGWWALPILAAVSFAIGTIATHYYLKHEATNLDPREVVIDEVAGQSLALTFVMPTLTGYAMAFILFRLFDVLKPWPICVADQKIKGAVGVMADDILAGLAAMFLPLILLLLLQEYEISHSLVTLLKDAINGVV